MRARWTRYAVTSFALVALVMGPMGAAHAVVAATIRGSGSDWRPARVTIDRGQTVRWRAVGNTHTVTAYGGGWSKDTRIRAGETTRRTFNETGVFRFYCKLHADIEGGTCSGMCGRVTVT
jgi:plastocyanin